MPKYPGISPYDNEKGTLGTAKKRWEKIYVKEIESDTVSGINATIENLATTATNSVSAAVSAKNDAVVAKTAAEAAQTAAETAAAGIQSVVETDVDNTLSIAGVAADAKVTGDWLRDIAKPVTLDTSMPATAYAKEYTKVTTDSEGRVLYGVKRDGSFTWQKGVPKHLQDKINELAAPTIDNDEYMYVMLDSKRHVIFGVKRDGSVTWQKGTPQHVIEACNPTSDNPEYLYLIKDPNDRVIFGLKVDGSVEWPKGVPTPIKHYISQEIDKSKPSKEMEGIRWAAFGDSYTSAASTGGIKKYPSFISEDLGLTVLDYGKSGTGYKNTSDAGGSFLERIQTLNPDDFDVITIFGSGNDRGHTLGTINDTSTDTTLGCINLTIEAYYDVAGIRPIGIVTPSPWTMSHDNSWMMEYSNAIIEIARKNNIPCMNLYDESGIRAWDESFAETFFQDTVHLNPLGHKTFLVPKFKEFLRKLV